MIETSSGKKYYTEDEVKKLHKEIEDLKFDNKTIIDSIFEKAVDKDWCSEYDEWADEINRELRSCQFPFMKTEYKVTITLERTQRIEVTIEVEATDEDDAEEIVDEKYSMNELVSLAEENDDWNTQNTEIYDIKVSES